MRRARLMLIRSTKSYGGPERQVLGFARRFNPRLFEPVVCSFTDKLGESNPLLRMAADCGMETALIPALKAFDLQGVDNLRETLKEREIDIICPQDYRANIYTILANRRLNIPVVTTVHGYAGNTLKVRLYELLDRFVLHYMDRVVCVSEALKTHLSRCGIPKAKLHQVYNCIDINSVKPDSGNRVCSAYPVVCSVGRLSIEKGHRFLIDAWRGILARWPSARLMLVGDGPERRNLDKQVSELGIESSVVFVGHTDRPMDYVQKCDIFVLPSLTEGLPVAILEACAAGKPVVASNVGGIHEVVVPSRTGTLVRPGQVTELSEAISRLAERQNSCIEMGACGRKIVEERFCFEKNVPLLEEIYLSCLSGDNKATAVSGVISQ